MNYSKSATSVMVCGSADGVLLPPYVIYKSLHLYDTWKNGDHKAHRVVRRPVARKVPDSIEPVVVG